MLTLARLATAPIQEKAMVAHSIRSEFVEAAVFLGGLAHPVRLLIVSRLMKGEASVGELEVALGLRQPTLSQHLAALREVGLVSGRRDARQVIYSVVDPRAPKIVRALSSLYALGQCCADVSPRDGSYAPSAMTRSRVQSNGSGGDR